MGLTGMERAMYMAVNKNTDELYAERVDFDPVEFAKLKARAERVIKANEPPLRCSNDPSWYVCKICDLSEHCHGTEAPAINCRTCAHSTPEMDGNARWSCGHHNESQIPIAGQRIGCGQHRYIPILLERFATQSDYVNGDVVYTTEHGDFANGEQLASLTSHEIRDLADKSMLGEVAKVKAQVAAQGFTSKVVS
jgi:hypothetical protein